MHYDLDTLVKLGSVANIDVPLAKMTERTKNAVKRSIKRGYMDSTTGQAATYLAILADRYQLPIIAFSKKGTYWNSLFVRHLPVECAEGLSQWWQADRVMYRLEHPDEWAVDMRRYQDWGHEHNNWYADVVKEPDWDAKLEKEAFTVRIMGTKELSVFEPITQLYTNTDDYKVKANNIIQLINEGATINVEFKNIN